MVSSCWAILNFRNQYNILNLKPSVGLLCYCDNLFWYVYGIKKSTKSPITYLDPIMTFLTDFTIGRYIVVHIDNLIFKYSFYMVKGKVVRTPSGVYGQDISLTQGTSPA